MMAGAAAEFIGSLLLAATVIGSGIMAEQLAAGNVAIALLANTFATCGALYALITVLGPVSGAHFNPLVSAAMWLRGALGGRACLTYGLVQALGMILGAVFAHAMFDMPLLQWGGKLRAAPNLWFSEAVATFSLLLVILGCGAHGKHAAGPVAAVIGAAYWFTASTSFANPAITLARSLSDTFAGIRPADVPAFVLAQCVGGILALVVTRAIFRR
jgi:glycerol uptake facilitator-like aquaporin